MTTAAFENTERAVAKNAGDTATSQRMLSSINMADHSSLPKAADSAHLPSFQIAADANPSACRELPGTDIAPCIKSIRRNADKKIG